MALTQPRPIFGVCAIGFYDPDTKIPYRQVEVVGSAEYALEGELVKLEGGSSSYPFAIGSGSISASINLTLRQYEDSLFELFLGKAPTATTPSGGAVSDFANYSGTSVLSATTGVADVSVTALGASKLITGKYVLEATSATAGKVYKLSNVGGATMTDNTMAIGTFDISAGDSVLTDLGLTIEQGSGTVGMTTGDTAVFNVVNENVTGKSVVKIGSVSDSFKEFGMVLYSAEQNGKELTMVDCYRCKASGMPIVMTEKEFSEFSVTVESFRSASEDGVAEITMLT